MPGGAAGQAYRRQKDAGRKYSGPPGTKPGAFGLPEPLPKPGTFYGIGSPNYNYGAPGKGPGFQGYEPGTYDAPANLQAERQAAAMRAAAQYQTKLTNVRNEAKGLAKDFYARARALQAASIGRITARGQRQAAYWGLDLKKAEGRRQAAIIAQRLKELANNSYSEQGAQILVNFEHQTRKEILRARNAEAAAAKRAADKANEGHINLGRLFNPLANPVSPLSPLGRALGVDQADLGAAGKEYGLGILNLVEDVTEPFQRAYYASQLSRNRGGSLGEQLGSFGAGLPGLGFTATDNQRRNIEATNTRAERDVLTERGDLTSFGRFVTGDVSELNERAKGFAASNRWQISQDPRFNTEKGFNTVSIKIGDSQFDLNSAIADAAFQIGTDPTLAVGKFLRPARNIGRFLTETVEEAAIKGGATREAAQQLSRAARSNWTDSTMGRGVIEQTVRAARKSTTTVDNYLKLLGNRGVQSRETAAAMVRASEEGGDDAVAQVLKDAFTDGVWQPERSVVARTLASMGVVDRAPGETSLTVRQALQSAAEKGGSRAPRAFTTNSVSKALDYTMRLVADEVKDFAGNVIKRASQRRGARGSLIHRVTALETLSESLDSPGFRYMTDQMGLLLDDVAHGRVENLTPELRSYLENNLDKLEVTAEALTGAYGDRAAAVAKDQVDRLFVPKNQSVQSTAQRLARDVGRFVADAKVWQTADYQDVVVLLDELPDGKLKDALEGALGRQTPGTASYGKVVSAIDEVVSSPRVREQVIRAMELRGDRDVMIELLERHAKEALTQSSTVRRILSGSSNFLLSLVEKAPNPKLRLLVSDNAEVNKANIVDAIDRYAAALRLPAKQRAALIRELEEIAGRVARGGNPEEAVTFFAKVVSQGFEQAGLDSAAARRWAEGVKEKFQDDVLKGRRPDVLNPGTKSQAFGIIEEEYDEASIKLLGRPAVGSQAQTTFTLQDLETIRQGIRKELQEAGQGNLANTVRVWWDETKEAPRALLNGKSIKDGAAGLFKMWKVMVTTRMYMVPILFAAGLATGDFWTALQFGAAGGLTGLVRYSMRNSLQARFTGWLSHGYAPEEHVGGLSHIFRHSERQVYGSGLGALFPEDDATHWLGGRLSRITKEAEDVWVVYTPSQLNDFTDAYYRVLNYQMNPETDEVMRLFLMRSSGQLDDDGLKGSLKAFLKTEDGELWTQRMRALGYKKQQQAVDSYAAFVRQYAADPEVAAARLAPGVGFGPNRQIPHDTIKAWAREEGKLSRGVHSQRVTSALKNPRKSGPWQAFKRAYQHAAYDAPSKAGFRETYFFVEAQRTERQLLATGVEPERARRIAEEVATRRTNEVLYRWDNGSRFARKVDPIAPFTGERLFHGEVWAKLMLREPGRTIRTVRQVAHAYNEGKENGMFTKGPTGSYQLAVPGSAWLSQKLFGLPETFDGFNVKLTGFFSVTAEMDSAQGWFADNPVSSVVGANVPKPGGLWWAVAGRTLKEVHPELFGPDSALPKGLRDYLFPYGPETELIPPDAQRLLRFIVGDKGPWWLLDDNQGVEELNKWRLQMAKTLITEHRREHPSDLNWFPTDKQIDDRTKAFFTAWAFFQGVMPAAPHPRWKDREQFEELWGTWFELNQKAYSDYSEARQAFVDKYPVYAPFLDSTQKYVGEDDYKEWEAKGTRSFTDAESKDLHFYERLTGEKRYQTPGEYRAEFTKWRRIEEAGRAFQNALDTPGDASKKERALQEVRDKFPEQAKYYRNKYNAERALARILTTTPKSRQPRAIDAWRKFFAPDGTSSLTYGEYESIRAAVQRNLNTNLGSYQADPWKLARDSEDVWRDVRKQVGSNDPQNWRVVQYVTNELPPAEQVGFWNQALIDLTRAAEGHYSDNADVPRLWGAYRAHRSAVYANNPILRSKRPRVRDTWEQMMDRLSAEERWDYQKSWNDINATKAAMDQAAKDGNWTAFYQLKAKRDSLFDLQLAIQNRNWQRIPESQEMHDALKELVYFVDAGAPQKKIARLMRKVAAAHSLVPFFPTNEQARYLNMPKAIQRAYTEDIVRQLNLPLRDYEAGSAVKAETGLTKKYWNELTEFQKSLLEKFAPRQVIDGWAAQDRETDSKALKALNGARSGFGYSRGRRFRSFGSGEGELDFAYAMFKKYNRRGNMPKPAAYDEYLTLPNNPAIKNQFLEKHPEVAEYIRLGPMASMPPLYQMMVADIMVRYGKWEGDPMSTQELTDLAFARQQLEMYNRRGDRSAPATYDLWLNMPSGQAKADFLNAHPEIGEWLQLGPMAAMPDMYREVVRDIMLRYHEWTAAEGGIGKTIQEYYRTPSYAREAFLLQHPELPAYWAATQSNETRALHNLADEFYAIGSNEERRAFLAAHPELGRHFMEARTRRYERFLNQVAVYMGTNPELFRDYLENQERILEELLNKFAEPSLVREQHWLRPPKAATSTSEGGRKRVTA